MDCRIALPCQQTGHSKKSQPLARLGLTSTAEHRDRILHILPRSPSPFAKDFGAQIRQVSWLPVITNPAPSPHLCEWLTQGCSSGHSGASAWLSSHDDSNFPIILLARHLTWILLSCWGSPLPNQLGLCTCIAWLQSQYLTVDPIIPCREPGVIQSTTLS